MKSAPKIFLLVAMVAAGWMVRAQQVPVAHAKNFTSKTYYEPPNEQQVKMKLTGAESLPLPAGLQDIRELRIDTFNIKGQTEIIVQAPQCNYSLFDRVATSDGPLELETGDGKFHLTGVGFLWRQDDSLLIISNNVHTIIKTGDFRLSAP